MVMLTVQLWEEENIRAKSNEEIIKIIFFFYRRRKVAGTKYPSGF